MELSAEGRLDVTHVYIIAEAGVNHNGDVGLARKLVDAAKEAGADAVKFQTFKTEKILTRNTTMAAYQKENLGSDESQFEMIKALELSYADFAGLQAYAESIGIDFLSTPDDEDSLDFLAGELDLPWIKIGSGEVTNLPFLRKLAGKQKPLILSTGMSTIGEVERAVRVLRSINQRELVLLHCTTNYPCPPAEVNLRAMVTLQRAFNVRVGYSDHTVGSEVPVAAVALGAEMIEKHITLDKNMDGPDHRASMDPVEFGEMVRQVRAIEVALGDGVKWPNPSEEKIKPLVRRRVVAAKTLAAGTALAWDDLSFKRANHGIYVEEAEGLIGRALNAALAEDEPLDWIHVGTRAAT
jgi:N-acetylneuraminate synthase